MSAGNAKHLGHPPTSKMHENAQQVKEFLFKNYNIPKRQLSSGTTIIGCYAEINSIQKLYDLTM
jgi:hypothetical protein